MPLTTSERFLWMAISSTSAPVHLRVPIHLNLFAFPPLLMASTLKNDPASSPRRKKRSISKSGWSTNVSNWAHFDGISFFVLLEKFELHWLVFFCLLRFLSLLVCLTCHSVLRLDVWLWGVVFLSWCLVRHVNRWTSVAASHALTPELCSCVSLSLCWSASESRQWPPLASS